MIVPIILHQMICVENDVDSSKDAGKLMIPVLSAVPRLTREN